MKTLQELIDKAKRVVFFGGAGVSTESGIPDFRSVDGLYHTKYKYPPETILSNTFFCFHPEEFYDFYREKMLYLDAKPNAAHLKLAEMEKKGKLTAVVTQNIDGLHIKAGSVSVFELHGTVHRNICQTCGKVYDAVFMQKSEGIPHCTCGGVIKPDVVLYGEGLDQYVVNGAIREISMADLLIVAGTSLAVYPAASFLEYYRGSELVVINREATPVDDKATLVIHDSVGQVLSEINV